MELKGILEKKKALLIVGAMIVAVAAVLIVFFVVRGNKGYRTIQIYELNGEATLERKDTGEMDAYENLMLKSEDKLAVASESTARLKMDEDKYMLIEPESAISIHALGDEKNSETDIYLDKGAVTVEIQKKLSKKSSYRVTTPNSVMAVRGTVFQTRLALDEEGNEVTKLFAFEGTVAVSTVNEDGELSEEVLVHGGEEAVLTTIDGKVEMECLDKIDYDEISLHTLEYLQEIEAGGRSLCISSKELGALVEEREEQSDMRDSQTEQENGAASSAQDAESEEPTNQNGQNAQEAQATKQPTTGESQKKPVHTVTFLYQGEVFGTQKVMDGQMVEMPKLMPAQSGEWDFDFSTPIHADTQINFK